MKTFHGAMHARIGQAGEGRESQTKSAILKVCQRLSSLSFVAFAVTVADVLQNRVVPLALRSQQIDVGSWEVGDDCHKTIAQLSCDREQLTVVRRWCFITAMFEAYARARDLHSLWLVLAISPLGHPFRLLTKNMHNLLRRQLFHGCQLSVELPKGGAAGGAKFHTLHSRCQCFAQHSLPGAGGVSALAPVLVRGRTVLVPEWVAFTGYTKNDLAAEQKYPAPRNLRVERERAPPPGLQGVSRFRRVGPGPRCVVSEVSNFAIQDLLLALFEVDCFLSRLIYFFQASLPWRRV